MAERSSRPKNGLVLTDAGLCECIAVLRRQRLTGKAHRPGVRCITGTSQPRPQAPRPL